MADSFPLYVPAEAPRLHQSESLLRRFAQLARWGEGSALLELYGTPGAVALAQGIACHLTIVEPDAKVAAKLQQHIALAHLEGMVAIQPEAVRPSLFAERAFDGIFSFGRVLGIPAQVARAWRPHLAENGRLGLTAVVKVGRTNNEAVLAKWKERIGSSVLSPRETLMTIEAEGYEPELIETPGEQELDEYYRHLETMVTQTSDGHAAGANGLKDEITWHRSGKTGITIAFIVARRREPNEKPLPSRDGG